MEKGNKLLFIVVVVGLLHLVSGHRVAKSYNQAPECQFSLEEPTVGTSNTSLADTDSYEALASFSGYLKYYGPGRNISYLQLNLKSVSWKKNSSDEASSVLTLATDCATIHLNLVKDERVLRLFDYVIEPLAGNITWANDNDGAWMVHNSLAKHYVSSEEMDFRYDSLYALTITQLEFEVDGDPIYIKGNEYSTPRHIKSNSLTTPEMETLNKLNYDLASDSEFSKVKPESGKLSPIVVDISSYKAIASFSGYLLYHGSVWNPADGTQRPDDCYLPLTLKSITWTTNSSDVTRSTLLLNTDRALIHLYLEKTDRLRVVSYLVQLRTLFGLKTWVEDSSGTHDLHNSLAKHLISFDELKLRGSSANVLTITWLEFEVDGDSKLIRNGRYSTPRHIRSDSFKHPEMETLNKLNYDLASDSEFSRVKPEVRSSYPVVIDTSSYKAIASFSGYLLYYGSVLRPGDVMRRRDDCYLPLALKSITWTTNSSDATRSTLLLNTDRALIHLHLKKTNRLRVVSDLVQLRTLLGLKTWVEDSIGTFDIHNSLAKHFVSSQEIVFRFPSLNALTITWLEFEVDGNPELIKQKQYSTPRHLKSPKLETKQLVALNYNLTPEHQFSYVKPSFINGPQMNVADTDNHKAIASFSGYLKYFGQNRLFDLYLPLKLESVSWTASSSDSSSSKLSLMTDCATIDFYLKKSDKLRLVKYRVEMNTMTGKVTWIESETGESGIKNAVGKHYINSKELELRGSSLRSLIINRLEFEVDGDPEVIRRGKYSTQRE